MALENLKENIEMEKKIIAEMTNLIYQLENLAENKSDKELLKKVLYSSMKKIKILNDSVPFILDAISPYKNLENREEMEKNLVKLTYSKPEEKAKIGVTIKKKSKTEFLKELSITEATLKRLRKKKIEIRKENLMEFKKANFYARFSNKLFLDYSTKLSNQGKLKRLNSYLRKANMSFLVTTYFSIVLLSTFIALILGAITFIVFLFVFSRDLVSILRNFLIIPALPLITFISLYFYPYAEGKGIESKIENELPFITIHMSAIAGSGIEPTQIFKIVALSDEYKSTRNEFKKIVNQINVYGYDLITALKNTARETSSKKLAELLNGMAITISSGGSIAEFLDKRADSLLFQYRLDRERKTKSDETFMDIYISIVVAAPMILTLLLVLISISGIGIGMSLSQLTIIILSIVSLINIVFLTLLHLSQTKY